MRHSLRGVLAGAALAIVFGAPVTAAQQGEPAAIPTPLANALVAPYMRMFGERPQFVVARAPKGWPSVLKAPSPATLVGGMTLGPMLSVVYRYPQRVNAVDALQHVLSDAGFTRNATPGMPRGGFTSENPRQLMSWCGANGVATVQDVDSTAATRSVLVTFVSSKDAFTACSSSESFERSKPPLEIPTLTAPFGVGASAQGTGWSGENIRAGVTVDTTLSADSILAHYTRQLTAAGWQAGRRMSDGNTALQPLSARDSSGKEWVGALILITAADRRTVTLDMTPAISERTARLQ